MKHYGVFDILGPVMVGPSSSHTAGACRIARAANQIARPGFSHAHFYLHGSFAKTYRGHGTDRALLAGLLGCGPDDERLPEAFALAEEKGLRYTFEPKDLGDVHPNTAQIVLSYPNGDTLSITGSSIGGGNIKIVALDEVPVDFDLKRPTAIVRYPDDRGVIWRLSGILAAADYNIESLRTQKDDRGIVTLTVETDRPMTDEVREQVFADPRFIFARAMDKAE